MMSIVLLSSAVAFTPVPDFDTDAFCAYALERKYPSEETLGECIASESAAKSGFESFWSDMTEFERQGCVVVSKFSGSYRALQLCAVASTPSITRDQLLTVEVSDKFVIENAPPCDDGAKQCAPWERRWGASDRLGTFDRVLQNGIIVRREG